MIVNGVTSGWVASRTWLIMVSLQSSHPPVFYFYSWEEIITRTWPVPLIFIHTYNYPSIQTQNNLFKMQQLFSQSAPLSLTDQTRVYSPVPQWYDTEKLGVGCRVMIWGMMGVVGVETGWELLSLVSVLAPKYLSTIIILRWCWNVEIHLWNCDHVLWLFPGLKHININVIIQHPAQ